MHQIHTSRGAHKHCDAIRAQVQEVDEKTGNVAFCRKETPEMKAVVEEARAHAENGRGSFVISYKQACRKWMKDNRT